MRDYHDEREGRGDRKKVSVRHKGNQRRQGSGGISDQQTELSNQNYRRGQGNMRDL